MSRYIDAEKLKERLGLVSVDAITLYEMGINAGLHRAEAEIEMLPTADVVEVRHGEWKYNEGGGYVCSECNCWLEDYYGATPEMMNYCFKCGAKMDGERRESNE